MKSISQFIAHSAQLVSQKLTETIGEAYNNFKNWKLTQSTRRHKTENDSFIAKGDNLMSKSGKHSRISGNNSKHYGIQSEKKTILEQIKALDQQITEIKGQQYAQTEAKKKEALMREQEASDFAKRLVNHYKIEKQQKQEKKRRQTQNMLLSIKQEEQEFRKLYKQQHQKRKSEKRREISIRIEDCKQKRKERLVMDRESNKLISQLKKDKQILDKKSSLPQEILELQQKKAELCERKQEIDFKQIQEHERKYIANKQKEVEKKEEKRAVSNGHHEKYIKNVWAAILEVEQKKRKEQQKVKQMEPKKLFDRRMKYGELVKSLFVCKSKEKSTSRQPKDKSETPEISTFSNGNITLPKISESQKKISETKAMRQQRKNKRIETSPSHFKSIKTDHRQIKQKSPEEEEQQKVKRARLAELKKETNQRLRRMDNQTFEVIVNSQKPRYKNYLGTIKLKKKEKPKEWRKIMENSSLSQEQKCFKMLKQANMLEQEAKKKEQIRTEAVNQESIELYINSIQAKLALLQQF